MSNDLVQKTHAKVRETANLTEILNELRDAQSGIKARQNIIREIEELEETKLVLYVESIGNPKSGINHGDAVPLGNILDNIGDTDNIDLLIQSGGGDGNAGEKIIEMCRARCKNRFRVIVPNMAKSAATLITFGADEIIMGYLSELGPIDAQIPIKVSGQLQFISAQSFIDSRDDLVRLVTEARKNNKDPLPYLQHLSASDIALVNHCQKLMDFAVDMGIKWLSKFMLKDEENAKEKAKNTANTLRSVSKYLLHGRMINADELIKHPDIHLKVKKLEKDDPLWKLIWELYVRCEIYLNMAGDGPKVKLIESAERTINIG
jgi:hypothetical protein